MLPPADGDKDKDLNRFWGVLLLLAQTALPAQLRGKVGASDLVQQTLLAAHQNRDQFRGQTKEELEAWLRAILNRKVIDAVRAFGCDKRDVKRERSLERAVEASAACLEHWWADADRFDQMRRLADALAELPEDQRAVMELRHCRGMKLKDIAGEVGRTPGAVAGLLRRGWSVLQARFQEGQP